MPDFMLVHFVPSVAAVESIGAVHARLLAIGIITNPHSPVLPNIPIELLFCWKFHPCVGQNTIFGWSNHSFFCMFFLYVLYVFVASNSTPTGFGLCQLSRSSSRGFMCQMFLGHRQVLNENRGSNPTFCWLNPAKSNSMLNPPGLMLKWHFFNNLLI